VGGADFGVVGDFTERTRVWVRFFIFGAVVEFVVTGGGWG
jgi:hypothetical protein